MVGRYQFRLVQLPAPDSRWTELCSIGHSLLDHRHRWLCFRQSHRSSLPRTICALVPVRHVQSDSASARYAQPRRNERWSYGPEAQKILVSFDRLRYRLLPYTYSLAWKTTNESYSPMRPLVMDFRSDVRAQNTWDEFMYGPAFLVNPLTEPAATSRRVSFPDPKWSAFGTGPSPGGPREITAEAPLDQLPLYIRAGSIVPMGPDVE